MRTKIPLAQQNINLGGPYNGWQSPGGLIGGGANSNSGTGMVGSGERSTNRQVMRRAFGNQVIPVLGKSPLTLNKGTTPFRLAFSAGDVMGTHNKEANRKFGSVSNQISGINSVSRLPGHKGITDGIRTNGTAAYCGNPKWVYDSSDYIKYRKLRAENKNYNDYSFGGDKSHSSQSALNNVIH